MNNEKKLTIYSSRPSLSVYQEDVMGSGGVNAAGVTRSGYRKRMRKERLKYVVRGIKDKEEYINRYLDAIL